jgi:hypothetical protein
MLHPTSLGFVGIGTECPTRQHGPRRRKTSNNKGAKVGVRRGKRVVLGPAQVALERNGIAIVVSSFKYIQRTPKAQAKANYNNKD